MQDSIRPAADTNDFSPNMDDDTSEHASTLPAALKVFGINELLESTLLESSFRDLYKLKSVAGNWKNLIENSIRLRRAMFLSPDGDPILLDRGATLEALSLRSHWWAPVLKAHPIHVSPLFRDITAADAHVRRALDYTAHAVEKGTLYFLCWYKGSNVHKALPAGVQSTFLTQPPITAIRLHFRAPSTPAFHLTSSVSLQHTAGITIGMVTDAFAEMIALLPTSEHDLMDNKGTKVMCWFYMGI